MGEIAASSKVEENIDNPIGPLLYMISLFYCITTALSQGGVGVGMVWGDQLCRRYLAGAGFTPVDAHAFLPRLDAQLRIAHVVVDVHQAHRLGLVVHTPLGPR